VAAIGGRSPLTDITLAQGASLAARLGADVPVAAGMRNWRPFINEAVADLVEAATPLQARVAFDQLDGTLTTRIAEIDRALFDLIVSNPPYIADDELAATPPDVHRFEPHTALLGGELGLDFYHRIVPAAPPFLRTGGWLAVEVADGKAGEVCRVFERYGRFERIEVHDDLGGTPRVVAGREKK